MAFTSLKLCSLIVVFSVFKNFVLTSPCGIQYNFEIIWPPVTLRVYKSGARVLYARVIDKSAVDIFNNW
jgi:hypothetical protein